MQWVIFLFIIISFCVYAKDKEYIVSGNTKTSTRFIERLIEKCNLEDEKALEQCLMNSRLFSKVEIKKKDGKLYVNVADRWSIIPFPMIQARDDGTRSAGLFLMDGNFLGMGKMLVLGGVYANDNTEFFLMYHDRSLLLTDYNLMLSMGKGTTTLYHKDTKLNELDGYKEKSLGVGSGFGYKFPSKFRLSANFGYQYNKYDKLDRYSELEYLRSFNLGFRASWRDEDYKLYFSEGLRLSYNFTGQVYRSGEASKSSLSWFVINHGKEAFKGQVLKSTLMGAYLTGGDKRDSLKPGSGHGGGGSSGFRGVPRNSIWTDSFIALSFDYQIPIKHYSSGSWTFGPFYDLGFVNSYELRNENLWQNAFGMGTYFYLKKIMLPGLGLMLGRNISYNDYFIQMFIGRGM